MVTLVRITTSGRASTRKGLGCGRLSYGSALRQGTSKGQRSSGTRGLCVALGIREASSSEREWILKRS